MGGVTVFATNKLTMLADYIKAFHMAGGDIARHPTEDYPMIRRWMETGIDPATAAARHNAGDAPGDEPSRLWIAETTIGHPDYELLLGPILDNPAPEIRQDADIDMRREAQQDPSKRWWIAVVDQQVVAWCAAWHDLSDQYDIICGHNYEYGWRDREARYWSAVHIARQRWLVELGWQAWTVVHDEPLDLHIATGWRLIGPEGTNPAEMGSQHWQHLDWAPPRIR